MKKLIATISATALIGICHADSKFAALPVMEGQRMVLKDFADCAFEKGAWGNDISCLIPFVFQSDTDNQFVFFSAADGKYNDGMAWEVIGLSHYLFDRRMCQPALSSSFWFTPDQLWEVEYANGRKEVVYHNETSKRLSCSGGKEVAGQVITWWRISADTNGIPCKCQIHGGIEDYFADPNVNCMRNVIPHRFRGANAEIVKESSREQQRLIKARDNAWSIGETLKSKIANMHCKYLKQKNPLIDITEVYVVACDCNFDGVIDAYVSSDVEKVGVSTFNWTLYVNQGDCFVRPKKSLTHKFNEIEDLYIDSELCAQKESFFRFDRIGIPSYAMPVVIDNDKADLWSYTKHNSIVQSFRKKTGMANADFSSCLDNGTTGIASLRDIFVMHSMIVSAERLRCETVSLLGMEIRK